MQRSHAMHIKSVRDHALIISGRQYFSQSGAARLNVQSPRHGYLQYIQTDMMRAASF